MGDPPGSPTSYADTEGMADKGGDPKAAATLPTAWAFGAYKKGMGKPDAHQRERVAVRAIKYELAQMYGYPGINLLTTAFGPAVDKAVRNFQQWNALTVDGLVGRKTANALWRKRIALLGIPMGWLRALTHWESQDDPGAQNPGEGTYADGSVDRGLVMLNSTRRPLTLDEAFDPATALDYAASDLHRRAAELVGCHEDAPDRWHLAVGSWRTPVGAREWCLLGNVEPDPDGTWAQRAAHYVLKVNTLGRQDWVNPPAGAGEEYGEMAPVEPPEDENKSE